MNTFGTRDFASRAIVVALVSGLGTLLLLASRGGLAVGWALGGWLCMALIGVGIGIWLSEAHGTPGSGFLAALATGMLARGAVAAVGMLLARGWGDEALWPFLGGALAGYLPLQVFESIWFSRRSHAESRVTTTNDRPLQQRSSGA